MKYLTQVDVYDAANNLAIKIIEYTDLTEIRLWGVPRGGIPSMYALFSSFPDDYDVYIVDDISDANIIVDDIIDSGSTATKYAGKLFCALFIKSNKTDLYPFYGSQTDEWLVFPWENTVTGSTDDIVNRMCQYMGINIGQAAKITEKELWAAWNEIVHG